MKKIVFLLLLLSTTVHAQFENMSEADQRKMMEGMMQGINKMQECFANIDQRAIEQLASDSKKLEAEIRQLCRDGERGPAQDKAIEFSRDIAGNKELQAMRQCGEVARNMMPPMPFADINEDDINAHVCDAY